MSNAKGKRKKRPAKVAPNPVTHPGPHHPAPESPANGEVKPRKKKLLTPFEELAARRAEQAAKNPDDKSRVIDE